MHGDRTSPQEVLATDFSQDFIELMRMGIVYDFSEHTPQVEIRTIEECRVAVNEWLDEYAKTNSTSFLANAANCLMRLYVEDTA